MMMKFHRIQEMLKNTMNSNFQLNSSEEIDQNCARDFSDLISQKIQEFDLPRYKVIVQTYLGEQKGIGMNIVNKCFWD